MELFERENELQPPGSLVVLPELHVSQGNSDDFFHRGLYWGAINPVDRPYDTDFGIPYIFSLEKAFRPQFD